MKHSEFDIIGSEEWCSLPDMSVPAISARIDSGAKTSSLDAFNIHVFVKDGEDWVRFEVFPLQNTKKIVVVNECKIHDIRRIKNTSGISEKRYVIKTNLKLGNHEFEIEVTLANRNTMGFRMLIGREAMNNRFLVNPSAPYLLGDYSEEYLSELYKSSERKSTGLKIGLLASNPELYSNKRIIEAGEERGHEMKFLNVQHCYMKLDAVKPEIHYRGGALLDDLDAIVPRIKTVMTHYGCALIRQFDSIGTYCLNSASSIKHSRDKLYSSQLFSKNGLHIPITGFAKSPLDTNGLIEMVNGAPLIIKLLESTQGKGVVLAETNKAAESVINAFKSVQANILVQEFIKEAGGKDIRCFVIDNKVVASIQRTAKQGEFRSNIHQGGNASIVKITSEERKLAVKAAKLLGLSIAGVDIIRSNKGPLLLEVNSSPGLEGIEEATGKDIARLIIASIEKKVYNKEIQA